MTYETEITAQEGIINTLNSQLKQTKVPARTINWQHNNIGATRGITQRVLVVRKARKKLNSNVTTSRTNILSLREAILGRDSVIAVKWISYL